MTIDTALCADQTLAATHRAMWALGDYALMAEEVMAPLGPLLVAAAGIGPGVRVLDVAAGSGNISLPAARAGATVTSTDLTPELLQRSRERAVAEGLSLHYQEANAQALPFGDNTFDTVISAIGVMFAPDHQQAADELIRVCRPGGTIGLISWTHEGFFGRMLATIRPYRPSLSSALPPSALWGREAYIAGMLGSRAVGVDSGRGLLEVTRFDTAQEVHDYFKNNYGPTIEAYENIGGNRVLAAELDAQLVELADEYLTSGVMEWEYLLLTADKC
ncbi:class I SAM-dependent methyltransferase [Mycobacterium paragordonae]|uniref:Class I SAM-dependent methyltransferase n=1 Tax=Mycobacterium paragordonae TaxID=1389713 RepID=A0A4R5WS43_9MYCO|nr:class I SAM-dependent methyltransferase [Mycobacterium paragordonae]MDP7735473.1 class I SAM-dependent methyltransferase [Mycobacterium paragordonae]TDK94440.1 class I SAM-dependent methyltransferase [Mycobacterium paragordonae]TDL06341.1 class I SAM-dependent methyltransferase [Mycobacterium paragordonae]